MEWMAWILASSVLLSIYDLAKKASVRDNAVLAVLLGSSVCGAAAFMLALVAGGRFVQALQTADGAVIACALIKSAIVGTSWALTFMGLRTLPISIATPIRASSPAMVFLLALFLYGEVPTVRQGCGMILVFAGYWLFSWAGRHEGLDFFRSRAVWFAIGGSVVAAFSSIWDKYVFQVRAMPKEALQLYFQFGLVAFYALTMWFFHQRSYRRAFEFFDWRWTIPLFGIALAAADWTYFTGIAQQGVPISIASLVRRFSVVITFLVGARLFHEANIRRKLFALVAVLAGVVLLVW